MRIIAGMVRGHPLKAPRVAGLRPTSDLIRGAIFDMIGPYFAAETKVLDLYAGTGALGIEALSRGANEADFVEQHPRCCAVLHENLVLTNFRDRGRVICKPVRQALPLLKGPYIFVFIDPPYAQPVESALLEDLVQLDLVPPGSRIVIEHDRRTPMRSVYGALLLEKQRRHGDTMISLYRREGADVG